ncbi:MAG: CHASE domain-containing protein [Oligoflexus sp.]
MKFGKFKSDFLINRYISWLVLLSLVIGTLISWRIAKGYVAAETSRDFSRASQEVSTAIQNRLLMYTLALIHGKSFMMTHDAKIDREQFRAYLEHSNFTDIYPGTLALGYAKRVRHEELEAHSESIQREGFPDYRIYPDWPRPVYFPIVMIEPFHWRNQRAFGYDMFTETVRQEAMSLARDSGEPHASGKVTLVQESDTDTQPGFLIYAPVYDNRLPLETVEQRRHALLGFIYSPFRSHDFFQAIFQDPDRRGLHVAFRVFDGVTINSDAILFSSEGFKENNHSAFQDQIKIQLPGRNWLLQIHSLPILEQQLSYTIPNFILGFGLIIALLVFQTLRVMRKHLKKERSIRHETQIKAARDHILAKAGEILSSTSNSETVISKIASILVESFADCCLIDLGQSSSNQRLVFIAHKKQELAEQLRQVYEKNSHYPLQQDLSADEQVQSHVEFIHAPKLEEIGAFANSDEEKKAFKALNINIWLNLPLQYRNRYFGKLCLGRCASQASFTQGDQEFVEELGRRLVVMLDNTALYRQSQESLALLDTLISAAPVGFAFLDRKLRYGKMNAYLASLHQVDSQEVIGKTIQEVNPKVAPMIEPLCRQVLQSGEVLQDLEWSNNDSVQPEMNGHWLVTYYPVTLPGDGTIGVGVLSINITERKRSEEDLRLSEERFRQLADAMPQIVWTADKNGEVDYFNHRWFEYTAQTTENICNNRWLELIHPDDRQLTFDAWQQAVQSEQTYTHEYRLKEARSQEYRWHLSRAVRVYDPKLKTSKWFGTLSDIHDQKLEISRRRNAEEEVRQLNEELEQRVKVRTEQLQAANKELEAFSYSVSHDLRTPLRAIDGFSRLLQQQVEGTLNPEAQDYLRRVRAATSRMARLIDDMLILSRVSRQIMRLQKVNLSEMAEEIVSELRLTEANRQVDVKIASEMWAEADAVLIRAVLENLLNNSWKFTQKHEKAMIEFSSMHQNGENIFFVRDNGAGFDMTYADKLFGTFQRLHRDDEFPGTGVGLATVQRIIHRHGGRIWAEARLDEGATFYFTLA